MVRARSKRIRQKAFRGRMVDSLGQNSQSNKRFFRIQRMKIIMKQRILVCLSCIFLTSCPEEFDSVGHFYIKNNSKREIVTCVLKQYDHIGEEYPLKYSIHDLYDTIIHTDINDYEFTAIVHNATKACFWWGKEENIDSDTISVFILDKNTYETQTWESIVESKEFLARYDIPAKKYLDNFNFKHPLTYPPSKDIEGIIVRSYE